MWKDYTVYVDKIVLDGFHKIVQTSFSYFLKETDYMKGNPDPLFEAQLQLKPPEILFAPSLNYGEADGFNDQIEGLINFVYKQGSLVSRVAVHLGQENYQVKFIFLAIIFFCFESSQVISKFRFFFHSASLT